MTVSTNQLAQTISSSDDFENIGRCMIALSSAIDFTHQLLIVFEMPKKYIFHLCLWNVC